GDGEIASVRQKGGANNRDAKQGLRLAVARAHGRAALRLLVRQKVTGRDPKSGCGDEADRGEAACFHAAFSLRSAVPLAPLRNPWRVTFTKLRDIAGIKLGPGVGPAHDADAPGIAVR